MVVVLVLCLFISQFLVIDSYTAIGIERLSSKQIKGFVKYCTSRTKYWGGHRRYRSRRFRKTIKTVSESYVDQQ